MYLGGIDIGHRIGLGVIDNQQGRFSFGVSMAGDVTAADYGDPWTDIVVTIPRMTETVKNTLKAYLNDTIKQGGMVVAYPDAGDDLQVGATTSAHLLYLGMKATRIAVSEFRTEIHLRCLKPVTGGSRWALGIPVTNEGDCGGITTPQLWTTGSELTLEFWHRANAVPVSTFGALVGFESGIQPFVNTSTMTIGWSWNGGAAFSAIPIVVGDTHHYAFVLDSLGPTEFYITVYRDGIVAQARGIMGGNAAFDHAAPLDVSRSLNLNYVTEPGHDFPAARPYLGDFDEVRVWNTARTQGQIQANMTLSLAAPQTNLVGCWGFDSFTGTGRHDYFVNSADPSNPMLIDGTPTAALAGSDAGLF